MAADPLVRARCRLVRTAGDEQSSIVVVLTFVDASNGVGWTRVCIDLGSARTVAVVSRPDGLWQPVQFDGRPFLASGVFRSATGAISTGAQAIAAAMTDPDRYLADPARRISAEAILLGGEPVSGVDLVEAVFRRVLDQTEYECGGPLPEVVVVVPPRWGRKREGLLLRAAQYAGVRHPIMVHAAVAVAAHGDDVEVPVARWIAVCDLGARVVVTIVRRNVSRLEKIAELDADAGGDRIDDALATYLAAHHPPASPSAAHPLVSHSAPPAGAPHADVPRPEFPTAGRAADPAAAAATAATTGTAEGPAASQGPGRRSVAERLMLRTAKEAATTAPGVVVPGVNGGPAAMLTVAHVRAAAAPVLDTAVKAVRQAIEAAEVTPKTGCGLLLVGGTAHIPGLAEDFAAGTGLPTRVLPHPDLATACAAARADPATDASPTSPRFDGHAPPTMAGGPRSTWPGSTRSGSTRSGSSWSGARPVLPPWPQLLAPLVPAVVSILLAVYATLDAEGGDRWPGKLDLVMNTGQLAIAAVLAVVAGAAAGAHFGPALQPEHRPTRRPPPGLPIAAGLLGATGLALATAAFYAVAVSAYFKWPSYHAQLLRWTLIPTVPLAAIVAVTAWLAYRGIPEPVIGWGPAMTLPHTPIILAAVGMCTMTWAYNDVHPGYVHWRYILIARCGALLIGLATAYTVADRRLTQIVAAIPLAITTAVLAAYRTTGILAGMWIIAVYCWLIRRTWQIGTYGMPDDRAADRAADRASDRAASRTASGVPAPFRG